MADDEEPWGLSPEEGHVLHTRMGYAEVAECPICEAAAKPRRV